LRHFSKLRIVTRILRYSTVSLPNCEIQQIHNCLCCRFAGLLDRDGLITYRVYNASNAESPGMRGRDNRMLFSPGGRKSLLSGWPEPMENDRDRKGEGAAVTQHQLFSPDATESLQGEIQRVTFANDENGYAVVRLKVKGHTEAVTAVGTIISPKIGDLLTLTGRWSVHPRFGKQFQFDSSAKVLPTTAKGIEAYLASGIIKGIGPVMARERFGEKTLEVMDRNMERDRKSVV
jgi:hypothetical protein